MTNRRIPGDRRKLFSEINENFLERSALIFTHKSFGK
jgi:hypothetical protein